MGIVPNLLPHWMNEQNGLWLNNKNQLPDYIADFLQNWLEDNIKPTLTEEMEKTVENLPTEENFKTIAISLFDKYISTRTTSFEEQLTKLKTSEE